jgi:hypothetical protein
LNGLTRMTDRARASLKAVAISVLGDAFSGAHQERATL